MAHSTFVAIITPVVVILGLAIWLGSVFYAQRHPANEKKVAPLKHEVRGGAFQSESGGQVMLRRDATRAAAMAGPGMTWHPAWCERRFQHLVLPGALAVHATSVILGTGGDKWRRWASVHGSHRGVT